MEADLLDLIDRAARATEAVLARMGSDDRDRPTPCPEMTAGQVASHLIGGMRGFTTVAGGGELHFDADADPAPDLTHGSAGKLFRAAADDLVAAFGVPGRIEATYPMPWGPTTGAQLLGFELIEIVVHGWDVARGLGRTTEVDDDVARATLAGARRWVDDSVRVPGMFGPELAAPAGASSLVQLVAFLGRDPSWTP